MFSLMVRVSHQGKHNRKKEKKEGRKIGRKKGAESTDLVWHGDTFTIDECENFIVIHHRIH